MENETKDDNNNNNNQKKRNLDNILLLSLSNGHPHQQKRLKPESSEEEEEDETTTPPSSTTILCLPKEYAKQCDLLKAFLDDDTEMDKTIPIDDIIENETFEKMKEFMKYHAQHETMSPVSKPIKIYESQFIHSMGWSSENPDNVWDCEYVTHLQKSNPKLFKSVMKAANYIGCQTLLDLCCARVAFLCIHCDDFDDFRNNLGITKVLSTKELIEKEKTMPWSGKLAFPIMLHLDVG